MWLTYPPGFDPKKKGTRCCTIHGGPHTAFGDNWHYRWNTQTFAAQGYVVASVNYHGSAASATPSSTASPTAGASWNCRTWKPPPTGC
jgi:dipeptidyl aminopeptidase/acylaminoacyl peptidase